MSKDVNIHVKTQGTQQASADLKQVAQSTEELGVKSSRSAGWMKEAFTALVGPLGIGALVTLAVSGIRKIISAFDDMKRASAEAVHDLANTQRAASDFFEAIDAYTPKQRRAGLTQARKVQETTGLSLEASLKILEAQKRTFGEIQPQATEQFAGYWQLHAQEATIPLMRWMGESGINTPERQGQIMRLIGAVSGKVGDERLIEALVSRGEKFRYLGWTPEQSIMNIGKVIAGMSESEGGRAINSLFEAIQGFTQEKAVELGAPKNIAASEQARWDWLRAKGGNAAFMRKAFGTTAPYMSTLLFKPIPPEMQQEADYTRTAQAAAAERQRVLDVRRTAEGITGRAGAAQEFKDISSVENEFRAAIRDYGIEYLDYLKKTNPAEYFRLKALNFPGGGEEGLYTQAAFQLWRKGQPPGAGLIQNYIAEPFEQRLSEIEQAKHTVINNYNVHNEYHNEIIYGPGVGVSEPRADRSLGR